MFFEELGVLFVGEERLFPYLLGVRSSSSDCIGLFRFVLGIVPDCCKVQIVFMSVRGCSKLSLKILETVQCCMSFEIVRGFCVLFLVVSNCCAEL